ncbi:glucokinase [Parapedobacter soli]|uniref:glucokinase n=1 Tax=Parapedobacter soli TaxID=416955 RepID=UPI0021C61E07|nr:glucokinase [Parapedobacter soli]
MHYSLYFPQKGKTELQGKTILAADIGGTKTSLGLFAAQGDTLKLLREATVPSAGNSTFKGIVAKFLESHSDTPDILSIGVAGPVADNRVKLTNLTWELDGSELQHNLGIGHVVLLNDLEATAYGLAGLMEDDLATVFDHGEPAKGNMAILAPGTGLGEAGLFWDGSAYRPFATEGGHSDFAPQTELDLELYAYLGQEEGIVCWEHVVSGPGISRIYRFLRDSKGYKEPAWLTENFKNDSDPAAVISHAAMRELDATCIKTMELFVRYMAREATSLVLKHKATGGLLLGGGIPPRIYPLLHDAPFREQFIRNSHMAELLENVPIKVILNSKAALIGAAYYGAYGEI